MGPFKATMAITAIPKIIAAIPKRIFLLEVSSKGLALFSTGELF